jgi:hypothetical protein
LRHAEIAARQLGRGQVDDDEFTIGLGGLSPWRQQAVVILW